jgi:hypothetical protein
VRASIQNATDYLSFVDWKGLEMFRKSESGGLPWIGIREMYVEEAAEATFVDVPDVTNLHFRTVIHEVWFPEGPTTVCGCHLVRIDLIKGPDAVAAHCL